MESSSPARVLVVAHKTAATPALIAAVRERAAKSPANFTLLVPNVAHGLHKVVDAEDQDHAEADQILALAVPLLEDAAGGTLETIVGDPNPLDAIQDAVNLNGYDEIIVSTLPKTVSRWLKLDLPSKVGGLGLPVTTVTAEG
jgi:nucleotide-binding universal stress UspA family protein